MSKAAKVEPKITRKQVAEWVQKNARSSMNIRIVNPQLFNIFLDEGDCDYVDLLFCEFPGDRFVLSIERSKLQEFADKMQEAVELVETGKAIRGRG